MIVALRVFLPFALTYLLAYATRNVNAVAGDAIRADLLLDTADLGFLTSGYLAGFALFQLPFGILMDRYGPRKVEAATLLLAAFGCAAFAVAGSFAELVVGRFLMGVGAAMCLMAPFTAYAKWFSAERLPGIVGLLMVFGAMGAGLGGRPAEALIGTVGWPNLFAILGGLTVVAAAAILFVVPPRREPPKGQSVSRLTRELGLVLKSRALWRIAPLSATSQAGYLAVVGLWTGPWLRDVAGLPSWEAATWLSGTAIGLMAGFIGFGILASRAARVDRVGALFVWGTVLFAAVAVAIIVLPPWWATPLWLAAAGLGTGGVLTYSVLTRAFPSALAGRVNTTLNFIVFFFAFLVQWLFGVVLEYFPNADGTTTRLGYQVALGLLVAMQLLSYLPLVLVKTPPQPPASAA